MTHRDYTPEVTRVPTGYNCDGMKIITYFSDGKEIAKEILCDNGLQLVMTGTIPDGTVLEYYWVGTLHRVFTYANNRAHGRSHTFYPDGAIWMEQEFIDGLLHGPMKTFYKGGTIQEECTYKSGRLHGELKRYYEDGTLDTLAYFNEGKLDGDYCTYFQNGMPREKSIFRDGIREGNSIKYYETGELQCIDLCLEGRVAHRKRFDERGRLISDQSEPVAEIEEEKSIEAKEHMNRGMDLATMGCHKQAAEEFQRAISADPFTYEAYLRLAVAYRRLGFYGDCIDTLGKLLEINPHHLEARFNLAIAHVVTGNRGEALAGYHVLRDIDEGYAHGLMTILESPRLHLQ
ncbi:MAG TPA: hypothetical protein PK125_02460 [Syntrophorhabdus sp.]|jgi:antitoxin component YwqK of YwqJK toxin-antitoxin module|nr:hypothetical protein [Syntrophorhabdus sp.]MDI9557996.1 hypothetical protein [Pseudomonadota bacterium]OPX93622.1 MAG: MORN repeat variant [Syntrophorhabdus sp. PtaB.Bin027]OQB76917.1 MAG: MORN repeat variant [Deltaproteobacteria bacterium ADurb.Bin135]MBP8743954.1 hypothetical protein [Syntrophorhabdus sp.]